jgi:outer membrane protein OmpA-like peptidoglycan-associated protein
MPKLPSLLLASAVVFTTNTSVFGMPLEASGTSDRSFGVFFDPGAASLSKEGREIISVVAEQFAATHRRDSAEHILLTSDTDVQDSAALSNERITAVGNQLVRDGIQKKFFAADEHPSVHAEAIRLEEALDRRVSISIQENRVIGRL